MNNQKRAKQLAKAQRTYRDKKREAGAARLQMWLKPEASNKLRELSILTGKNLQESIEYAVAFAYELNKDLGEREI